MQGYKLKTDTKMQNSCDAISNSSTECQNATLTECFSNKENIFDLPMTYDNLPSCRYHSNLPPHPFNGINSNESEIEAEQITESKGNSINIKEDNDFDGGWGWVVVFAAFSCILMTEGLVNSFGIIILEIHEMLGESMSGTAWVESVLIAFYYCSGPAIGILINKLGCRVVAMSGAIISALGFCTSPLASSINTLIILYGLIGGAGFGMMFCASIVIIGHYFNEKKGMAMGIITSGSGIGTFITPPLLQMLLENFGLGGTVLIIGGMLMNGLAFGAVMRPVDLKQRNKLTSLTKNNCKDEILEQAPMESQRSSPTVIKEQLDKLKSSNITSRQISRRLMKSMWATFSVTGLVLLKNQTFLLIVISSSITMLGFFVPFVYIPKNAIDKGLDVSLSVFLISSIGISSTIGKITCGILADKIHNSSLLLYALSLILSGICLLLYPLADTMEVMVLLCSLFGLFISAYITLTPPLLLEIFEISKFSTAFGLIAFFRGMFSIIGPPAAGAVFDGMGSFDIAFYTTGVLMVLAGLVSISGRWCNK